jgi:hypothetical protein
MSPLLSPSLLGFMIFSPGFLNSFFHAPCLLISCSRGGQVESKGSPGCRSDVRALKVWWNQLNSKAENSPIAILSKEKWKNLAQLFHVRDHEHVTKRSE